MPTSGTNGTDYYRRGVYVCKEKMWLWDRVADACTEDERSISELILELLEDWLHTRKVARRTARKNGQ